MSDEDFIANISDSDSDNDFLGFASIDVPIHNKKKKKKKEVQTVDLEINERAWERTNMCEEMM